MGSHPAELTVGSLFTGIGGFDLGFERAGMRVAWQAERHRHIRLVPEHHWPDVVNYGDVRRIQDAPAVDVLCGGFPCLDISNARWAPGIGRGKGLAGDQSKLFFEFVRIARNTRPRPQWVVVENVPSLLSSNSGADMCTVVGSLVELGYGVAWRVLDSRGFGVPQRRRRVFIVGCLGDDRRAGQVLLVDEGGTWRAATGGETQPYVGTLTASGVGSSGSDVNQAQAGHLIVEGDRVRRLTPIECERLQGFPDDWTAKLSNYNRYRALGNAVTVPVARWIGDRIIEHA